MPTQIKQATETQTSAPFEPIQLIVDAENVAAWADLKEPNGILFRCGRDLYALIYADWLATERDPRLSLEHAPEMAPNKGEVILLGKPWGTMEWKGHPSREVTAREVTPPAKK